MLLMIFDYFRSRSHFSVTASTTEARGASYALIQRIISKYNGIRECFCICILRYKRRIYLLIAQPRCSGDSKFKRYVVV